MTTPNACLDCLRRSWLLSVLGPHLERATIASPGVRPAGLLALEDVDLAEAVAHGSGKRLAAEVEDRDEEWFVEELVAAGCWATCRHDHGYPAGLHDLDAVPAALIGRGDPSAIAGLEPRMAVTIVGARRATSYGREVARTLAEDLAAQGLVVVAGLDFGIDACAHRGALDAGGPTIAVPGAGPDAPYPRGHRSLWRRIAEDGAVVSELPPGSLPWRWTFLVRRRLMAAIGGMTVVVEAGERSGSLVTAGLAADLGRDVGGVPGPIISGAGAGPNALLADGACVVRGARDVIDALSARGGAGGPPPRHGPAYTIVGHYGSADIPYVVTVLTDDGPEAALALGHKTFEEEGAVDLELRIVALFDGEPRLVDPALPWGGGG